MSRLSSPIQSMQDHYTVVVVGSGYGGGIAASRLARAGQKVCLLERGREIRPGEYPATELEAAEEIQLNTPDGRIGFHTEAGFRLAVQARVHYAQRGTVTGYRLDAGAYQTVWGRMFVDACIPSGTAVSDVGLAVNDRVKRGDGVADGPRESVREDVDRRCLTGWERWCLRREPEGGAELRVRDTGAGLGEDVRRQLARDFSRLDSKGEGMGLGLAICRRIADVHGADISFLAREDGARGASTARRERSRPRRRCSQPERPRSPTRRPAGSAGRTHQHMLVLHANWTRGALRLWAESLDAYVAAAGVARAVRLGAGRYTRT